MNYSGIDFRHLRYFVAVADAGSFSAAATQLHISQPPVTRQIQQLEEILEARLFTRKARGIELTTAGETFLIEAKNQLALLEQSALRTREAAKGQLGRLDIGIFGSAIYGIIPKIIHAFRTSHPNVDVVLHTMERPVQIKALRERRLTAGFNRFFGEEQGLRWEKVHSESLNVAFYDHHEFSKKKSINISDLDGHTIILYPKTIRPSFIDHAHKLFFKHDVKPKQIYEVDDVITAIALTSSCMGITIVSESACNLKLPNVNYLPLQLKDTAAFDLDIIYREDDESPLLAEFLNVVKTQGQFMKKNKKK